MRALLFVLLTALLVACTDSPVPSGIIPPQKMETIIWQLMQSDEYANSRITRDSIKISSTEKMRLYNKVFDLNGTSLEAFKKIYKYYMEHPGITRLVFDSIAARAGRQRADIYKPKSDTARPKPAVPVTRPPDTLRKKPFVAPVRPDTLKLRTPPLLLRKGQRPLHRLNIPKP